MGENNILSISRSLVTYSRKELGGGISRRDVVRASVGDDNIWSSRREVKRAILVWRISTASFRKGSGDWENILRASVEIRWTIIIYHHINTLIR